MLPLRRLPARAAFLRLAPTPIGPRQYAAVGHCSRLSRRHYSAPAPALSLIKELRERGLAQTITGAEGELDDFVESKKVVVYAGVDPTASSLHVGHLLYLINLLRFYLAGHHSIALIGKATASVGDPSGRTTERDLIESERLKASFTKIWAQIEHFFNTGRAYAIQRGYDAKNFGTTELATNEDWLGGLGLIEFLRSVGGHIRVNQMLARDSVKARMESSQGINFAEFTYQLLQSYDFWHLYKHMGCRLQIGGNDQYGNITAGIDLISRLTRSSPELAKEPEAAYGLTVPLLTTSSGQKFGKSAGNAVWLDERLTSPFELYQYFVGLPDDLMENYLKVFTLLATDEISRSMQQHWQAPHSRIAQHLLAGEVVTLIHGPNKAAAAEVQTRLLFSGPEGSSFSAKEIVDAFGGDNRLVEIPRDELVGELLSKIIRRVGASKSRPEAENLIKAGGAYVGQESMRVTDTAARVPEDWLLDQSVLLLRLGKGKFTIVKAT